MLAAWASLHIASTAHAANNTCFDACPAETGAWDGDFSQIPDFCSCNFGGTCPYICGGGGGNSGSGAFCSSNPCKSGQYSFGDDGWQILVTQKEARKKTPYRAFAYLPFWKKQPQLRQFDFSVSLKTSDICKAGSHVKVLFWGDGAHIFSILPPGAPGDKTGTCRFLAFADAYPKHWLGEMPLSDEQWYDVKMSVKGSAFTIAVGGHSWTQTKFPGDISRKNGPQLGVYAFDFGGVWTTNSFKVHIGSVSGPGSSQARHDCEFQCLRSGAEQNATTYY